MIAGHTPMIITPDFSMNLACMQVLHIRNLPYETTHEELCELAQPFGRLVQSKLNVGPNRNQAFIEFPDQATAVAMCNYFNGNADPAKASNLSSSNIFPYAWQIPYFET